MYNVVHVHCITCISSSEFIYWWATISFPALLLRASIYMYKSVCTVNSVQFNSIQPCCIDLPCVFIRKHGGVLYHSITTISAPVIYTNPLSGRIMTFHVRAPRALHGTRPERVQGPQTPGMSPPPATTTPCLEACNPPSRTYTFHSHTNLYLSERLS